MNKIKSTQLVLLTLALIMCISIASANTVTYKDRIITIYDDGGHQIGSYMSSNVIQDLQIKNNIMYICTPTMLKAVDINNGKKPIGIQSLKGNFKQAIIQGNGLYTIKNGVLAYYDISKKEPKYIAEYKYKSPATAIEIKGRTLFVVYEDHKGSNYHIKPDGSLLFLAFL